MCKKKIGLYTPILFLVSAAILFMSGCESDQLPGEGGDFEEISGSGSVTVRILGADAGGYGGDTFYYGTVSAGSPMGGELVIGDDDESGAIESGLLFTGGLELEVGGFIDVNGNGATSYMADDGDFIAGKTITVSGNETVTLTYPTDFSQVSGSGSVTVRILGADSAGHGGKTFYFGTVSTGSPMGGELVIGDDDESGAIESGVIFTGGLELVVGGFIDTNGNGDTSHMADDGDWYAYQENVLVDGDTVVTFTFE